jgi:hypothetical protein
LIGSSNGSADIVQIVGELGLWLLAVVGLTFIASIAWLAVACLRARHKYKDNDEGGTAANGAAARRIRSRR